MTIFIILYYTCIQNHIIAALSGVCAGLQGKTESKVISIQDSIVKYIQS